MQNHYSSGQIRMSSPDYFQLFGKMEVTGFTGDDLFDFRVPGNQCLGAAYTGDAPDMVVNKIPDNLGIR